MGASAMPSASWKHTGREERARRPDLDGADVRHADRQPGREPLTIAPDADQALSSEGGRRPLSALYASLAIAAERRSGLMGAVAFKRVFAHHILSGKPAWYAMRLSAS